MTSGNGDSKKGSDKGGTGGDNGDGPIKHDD